MSELNENNKVWCFECGWKGLQGDCPFGHDDFYCPKCGKGAIENDLE